jgi:RNA recognition motif-containing protein
MRLFVGNLPKDLTNEELTDLFSIYGKVESAKIITDVDTGESRGFAFVEMESMLEGKNALEKLNGHSLKDKKISVEAARPKENRR